MFFGEAPVTAPARPYFAAPDDVHAGVPDALLRAGRAADVEMTSPLDAPAPDGEDSIVYVDRDDPEADYYELAEQQGIGTGPGQMGLSDDGQTLTDEQGNVLHRDVRNDPQYQALQQQLQMVQHQRQTEKSKEVADKIRAQMTGVRNRRMALFNDAQSGNLDMQGMLQRMSTEFIQSDQEASYWRDMTMRALGYVNRLTLMAQAVQEHGLTEAEAVRLQDVPDHQIRDGAAWLAQERQRSMQSADPRVAQLEAQVAELTRQVQSRGGRRQLNRAAFAVGGGSSAPAQPTSQRIRRGSDQDLAFQLFDPRGGYPQ
jgi:hypothetical protein